MPTREDIKTRFQLTDWQLDVLMDISGCSECMRLVPWGYMRHNAEAIDAYSRHIKTHQKKETAYAFTFTTAAKPEGFVQAEEALIDAAERLYRQESVPIKEGAAFLEYGEDGRPHVHGWYQTEDGGRVFSKVFHRCWPEWAEKRGKTKFAGGYHEVMKSNRYIGYANAEGRCIVKKTKP